MKVLSKFRFRVSHRVAVEAVHDLLLFIGAFVATGVLDRPGMNRQALVAAAITALRVVVRGLLPTPVESAVEKALVDLLHRQPGAAVAAVTAAFTSDLHTAPVPAPVGERGPETITPAVRVVAVPEPAVAPAPAPDVTPPTAPASPSA